MAKIVISSFQPLKENRFVIPKSRYDSISTYLSPEGNKYSDIDLVHDKEIYQQLVDAGLFLFYLITCIMYFCHNSIFWNPPEHDADSQMAVFVFNVNSFITCFPYTLMISVCSTWKTI